MTDAPNRPDPTEREPTAPGESASPGAPESSVERVEHPDAAHPRVERMEVDPDQPGEHLETEVTSDAVTVRRAPRYPAFILAGVAVGVVVALVLTFAFPENAEFDRGQVFGFLLLWAGAIGAALGGVVALVVDRMLTKRGREAVAEHEATHYVEDDRAS
ncbi:MULTISPECIES: hypothetical protein [unclassified Agromyces]|uniref:hypothetical protein n=1 Tax=unclassified Agromyces TaxID=2639701 RepID=UPI003014FCF6